MENKILTQTEPRSNNVLILKARATYYVMTLDALREENAALEQMMKQQTQSIEMSRTRVLQRNKEREELIKFSGLDENEEIRKLTTRILSNSEFIRKACLYKRLTEERTSNWREKETLPVYNRHRYLFTKQQFVCAMLLNMKNEMKVKVQKSVQGNRRDVETFLQEEGIDVELINKILEVNCYSENTLYRTVLQLFDERLKMYGISFSEVACGQLYIVRRRGDHLTFCRRIESRGEHLTVLMDITK